MIVARLLCLLSGALDELYLVSRWRWAGKAGCKVGIVAHRLAGLWPSPRSPR